MRGLLIGNYGIGNVGDEALKQYFLERFPEVTWTVVSASPKGMNEVARLPLGIRSFFSFRWIKTLHAFRHTDLVVFGGGTLFTDIESLQACFLWGFHGFVARFYRKPICMAFQGVGPFRTALGQGIARAIFRRARFISVRDVASAERVQSLALNQKIIQSFDPVLSLIHEEDVTKDTKNVFIIIPRKNSGEKLLSETEKILRERSFVSVRILLLEPGNSSELSVGDSLQKATGGDVVSITGLSQLLDQMRAASFVLSERFHGGIAALALGVPFEMISQGKGDKISALPKESQEVPRLLALVKDGEAALRRSIAEIS